MRMSLFFRLEAAKTWMPPGRPAAIAPPARAPAFFTNLRRGIMLMLLRQLNDFGETGADYLSGPDRFDVGVSRNCPAMKRGTVSRAFVREGRAAPPSPCANNSVCLADDTLGSHSQ